MDLGTAALVGGGGKWFLDKILGPSATAIGEQLRAYGQARLPTIFGSAAEKAKSRGIAQNIRPIPPGLLFRLSLDASFSADDAEITDWWSNLILDAALSATNKHAVFSDMMAIIGPKEASCFKEFMSGFSFVTSRTNTRSSDIFSGIETLFLEAARHWFLDFPVTSSTILQVRNNMTSGQIPWPLRPISWQYPFRNDSGAINRSNMLNEWHRQNITEIEILERAGILRRYTTSVYQGEYSGSVTALASTALGMEFYNICTNADRDMEQQKTS